MVISMKNLPSKKSDMKATLLTNEELQDHNENIKETSQMKNIKFSSHSSDYEDNYNMNNFMVSKVHDKPLYVDNQIEESYHQGRSS